MVCGWGHFFQVIYNDITLQITVTIRNCYTQSTFQRKMMSTKQMILPNMHARSPTHLAAAKISSMMATLEESLLASPVWMALTDSARHTLRYYVREYTTGHVTPDGLVLALSEILDNTEKVTKHLAKRVRSSLGNVNVFFLWPGQS